MGNFRERFDRFLAGPPSSDPLEISNRSTGQRVALGFLIGLPCLLAIAVIVLVMPHRPLPKEKDVLTPAQIAERMLPGLDKAKVETNRDVEVTEAHVDTRAPVSVFGSVRNNTSHAITGAEVTLQVANAEGEILGAVTHRFDKLAPKASAAFRAPLPFKTAYIVLVRDVKSP